MYFPEITFGGQSLKSLQNQKCHQNIQKDGWEGRESFSLGPNKAVNGCFFPNKTALSWLPIVAEDDRSCVPCKQPENVNLFIAAEPDDNNSSTQSNSSS